MRALRPAALFIACWGGFALTSYAGLRSPDAEVMYETCEALVEDGRFGIDTPSSSWPGFGIAPGRDGRMHSIFGPVPSMVCAPILAALNRALEAGWLTRVEPQPSQNFGNGLQAFGAGTPIVGDERPHIRRGLMTLVLGSLISALGVLVFFVLSRRLTSDDSALAAALVYAFASPTWWYSGTFFSEPFAVLFVLLSLLALDGDRPTGAALAGVSLGVAVGAHVTAVLFIPFFAWIAFRSSADGRSGRAVAWFCGGLAVPLTLLGIYNSLRFGSPLETGRWANLSAAQTFGYGVFTAPWRALWAMAVSPAKGFVLFFPSVLIAAFAWRSFRRVRPIWADAILAAVVVRYVFIATRSDWHGGFALGPRLLLLAVPLVLLSVGPWLGTLPARSRFAVLGAAFACSAQQACLVVKDVITAFRYQMIVAENAGALPFENDRIYVEWSLSPWVSLPLMNRAPWLLKTVPVSDVTLIVGLAGALGVMWLLLALALKRSDREVTTRFE